MAKFPDTRKAVRAALDRNGFQPAPAGRQPDRSIPVRYWPSPNAMFLGYLDVYETDAGYDMTFRAAPLHGQEPQYDLRIETEGADRG